MSVDGQIVWAWDNSHDIMLATFVEEAKGNPRVDTEWLDRCRVAASVSPYAAEFAPQSEDERTLLADLLAQVRSRLLQHGDFNDADLAQWSVLEGVPVSEGSLRTDVLHVADIDDVVDAVALALRGELLSDPPGGFWFYGTPAGRRFIETVRAPWEEPPEGVPDLAP